MGEMERPSAGACEARAAQIQTALEDLNAALSRQKPHVGQVKRLGRSGGKDLEDSKDSIALITRFLLVSLHFRKGTTLESATPTLCRYSNLKDSR